MSQSSLDRREDLHMNSRSRLEITNWNANAATGGRGRWEERWGRREVRDHRCGPGDHGPDAVFRTQVREVENWHWNLWEGRMLQSLPPMSSALLYFPKCLVFATHVIIYLLLATSTEILVMIVPAKRSTSNWSCHGMMATQIILLRTDYYSKLSKSTTLKK